MGFMSTVGTFLSRPLDSMDHGIDTTRKAMQAGIDGDTIDKLEEAGASSKEIEAAVSKAQERNKDKLLAEVSGDAPPAESTDIGTSPAPGTAPSGQALAAFLTAMTAMTAMNSLASMSGGANSEFI